MPQRIIEALKTNLEITQNEFVVELDIYICDKIGAIFIAKHYLYFLKASIMFIRNIQMNFSLVS